jgi:hypothetical protein
MEKAPHIAQPPAIAVGPLHATTHGPPSGYRGWMWTWNRPQPSAKRGIPQSRQPALLTLEDFTRSCGALGCGRLRGVVRTYRSHAREFSPLTWECRGAAPPRRDVSLRGPRWWSLRRPLWWSLRRPLWWSLRRPLWWSLRGWLAPHARRADSARGCCGGGQRFSTLALRPGVARC